MRKLAYIFFLFFISFAAYSQTLHAATWGSKALVTINDQEYSSEDFENWWRNWKEDGSSFPENLEEFIEWQLMAQEAGTMQLETKAGYKKKVEVFLKARSLMLLKEEAVLSKIDIPESEIKNLYDNDYQPVWNVSILYFKGKSDAETAYDDFVAGKKSFEDFSDTSKFEKDSVHHIKRVFRPIGFLAKPAWLEVVSKLKEGEISPVFQDGEWFVIVQLDKTTISDKNDYEKFKELIKKKIFKQKQQELTVDFVEKMKQKYEVQVDQEIFEKLGQDDFPEELLGESLVTTNRTPLQARIIAQQLEKEERLRTREPMTAEKKKEVKGQLLDGLIAEVVLGWESLERHYEERPPFKFVFEFYKKNRLKIALENWLFSEMAEIDDEQITGYYEGNIESYTKPEMVKIGSVETDLQTAKKIWLTVLKGGDFFNVAEKDFTLEVKIQEVPKKHLASEVQDELARLAPGDVSSPVEVEDKAYLIKLIDRKEKQIVPLDQVKGEIRGKLTREKFVQIRAEFVQKLKEHSTISINQKKWEAIQKEHRGENEI